MQLPRPCGVGWHPHSPSPSRQHSGAEVAGGLPGARGGSMRACLPVRSPSPPRRPTRSSSSDEQGPFHCQRCLARQLCHLDQAGFTDKAIRAHLTCPAEAEVIGDTRQPFRHPVPLILLIYRRSKQKGQRLSTAGGNPQCGHPQKGSAGPNIW